MKEGFRVVQNRIDGKRGELTGSAASGATSLVESSYENYVAKLLPKIKGQKVESAEPIRNGFLLRFESGKKMVSFLEGIYQLYLVGTQKQLDGVTGRFAYSNKVEQFSPVEQERRSEAARELVLTIGSIVISVDVREDCFDLVFDGECRLACHTITDMDDNIYLLYRWE